MIKNVMEGSETKEILPKLSLAKDKVSWWLSTVGMGSGGLGD